MAHKQVIFRAAAREKILAEATMTEIPNRKRKRIRRMNRHWGKTTVKNGKRHARQTFTKRIDREGSGGGRKIINEMRSEPAVSDAGVKYLIDQTFRRNLRLNPDRATVTIRDGAVKLWGSVPNWDQLSEIERAVRATKGVVEVENHLRIEL